MALGKTTLLKIAMGMLFPHGGSVSVFGMSPTQEPVAVKKRIGYVAEDQVLPTGSSIADLIGFHRYLFFEWDGVLERQTPSTDFRSFPQVQRSRQLSKGQAREVAFALRGVLTARNCLFLDEPAGGLDPATLKRVSGSFDSTAEQGGNGDSVLFLHHMGDVERIGARVVLLDQGKVLLDRDPNESSRKRFA